MANDTAKTLTIGGVTYPIEDEIARQTLLNVVSAVGALQNALDAMTNSDTTTAIETFQEVLDFLSGVTDSDTLVGKLNELRSLINGKYTKPSSGIPATDLADGVIPDTSNLATKTEVNTGLAGKVDKVTGYGLSKNDYTDADKAAVGTIGTKANDNVVVKSISVNGGEAQTPTQGNVNINVQAGSQVDPATASPSMDGTAAVGTSTKYAREDHVHPHDTSKQDALTFDNAPTANSNNMVKSGGIYTALQNLLSNITIGANGNWFIGETDTGMPSQGETGNIVATDGVVTFEVVNNLTSTAPNKGLSAKMGNELLKLIQQIYTSLGASAFWGTKPEIDWESVGFTMYNVTRSLSAHAHAGSAATKVAEGDPYTEEITFDEGYAAQSIVVLMGGVNISSTAVIGNTITIAEVTGAISITVTETAMIPVTYNGLVNCSLDNSQGAQPTMVAPGGTLTFKLKANNGYELPASVTFGASGTASIVNGVVTIQNVTETIDISATGTAITEFMEGGMKYLIDTNNTSRVETTILSGTKSDNAQTGANTGEKYSGDITIPATVKHDGAVYNVYKLGDYTFCHCDNVGDVTFEGGLIIGRHSFHTCGATAVNFNASPSVAYSFALASDGSSYAFYEMNRLERIVFPNNVDGGKNSSNQYINMTAYLARCSNLAYVKLGEGFRKVGIYGPHQFKSGCVFDMGSNINAANNPSGIGGTQCLDGSIGTLVIRATDGVLINGTWLSGTPTVYVPDALLSGYQAESSWSKNDLTVTFKALSEYNEPS